LNTSPGRSQGVEVVPSGDLIQLFEACWDDDQWAMHQEAARHTTSAFQVAFRFIAERVRKDGSVRETEVQKRILDHFAENDLITDHPPIVGVGPHSGDPHYAPGPGSDAPIKEGNFVLIDLWAKLNRPRAVYSDLTWTCFVGQSVPAKYTDVFKVVAAARDAGIDRVRQAFAVGEKLQGWQTSKRTRSGWSSRAPVSRSSREYTCPSLESAARWTCSSTPTGRSTSPGQSHKRKSCRC
jgi:Xaa-Pro aminopeptidase